MATWHRIRSTVIGALAVGLITTACGASALASGPLKILPSCARLAHSPVVFRSASGDVTVRRARVAGDGGAHDWACPRSGSVQASPLGTVPGGGFAPGVRVGEFLSVGPWLVDVASSRRGWASPFHLAGTRRSRTEHHEIELTDVADASTATASAATSVDEHLSVLSTHGGPRIAALVWTQAASRSRITLRCITVRDGGRHAAASSMIAIHPAVTGRIDPASVRLNGLRVSFTQDGKPRHLTLGV